MPNDATIYGEDVDALLPGFAKCAASLRRDPDGWYRISTTLTPDEGLPFKRALMRVEAELLCEDADRMGPGGEPDRTVGERRGEALVRLLEAIAAP